MSSMQLVDEDSQYESEAEFEFEADVEALNSEPFPESVYGFVMASLVKDTADMNVHGSLKAFRILSAIFLWLAMFGLQAFLLVETKRLVSPFEVENSRQAYDEFQYIMYEKHVTKTVNGYDRGVDGYFKASKFEKLNPGQKEDVCQVPMSQPIFLIVVIFIWALTVLNHCRMSLDLAVRLFNLHTIRDDGPREHRLRLIEDGSVEMIGLPMWLKLCLSLFQVARFVMCIFLLWLGSRYLTATLGFGNLLLNALALEFILNISELLYTTVVPYHNKLLVQRTLIPHVAGEASKASCVNMFGTMVLAWLALAYAIIFIFVAQSVLPDYKWDIHGVCHDYLMQTMSASKSSHTSRR